MVLLEVKDLGVSFSTPDGTVNAVNGVTLSLEQGTALGIVGESGSGKSQLAFAILGLLAKNGTARGSVMFDGAEILNAPPKVVNPIRANRIAMIFQDPMTSLNPYMRVSDQMAEVLIHHQGVTKADALAESVRMLDAVKIPDARGRIRLYPHEFSGGMRQRVMIAMSLLCRPDVLIADEPTTALDVTVQAQIMSLLGDLRRDFNMATILITHDLGVVAQSPVDTLFNAPSHPYTRGLLRAIPRVDQHGAELDTIPGSPPNMTRAPKGCPFAPRCDVKIDRCDGELDPLTHFAPNRLRACNRPLEEL